MKVRCAFCGRPEPSERRCESCGEVRPRNKRMRPYTRPGKRLTLDIIEKSPTR